jgi:SecD/SecF fusion protein
VFVDNSVNRIFVRYPWKSDETAFDPQQAIEELGSMAVLTFRDPSGNVVLEGLDIENTVAGPYDGLDTNLAGTYQVNLKMTAGGTTKFADATGRLVGQAISIYMDELVVSAPTVNEAITGGEAVITGQSTLAEAQTLSNLINSGALPFALEATQYKTISPTLGAGALNVMLTAGLLAFILIAVFMVARYRLPGFVAVISLTIQIAGIVMVMSIAQLTVTLPGLAGIILSVGMGVDANIIITERIREELRAGKTLDGAISSGFQRAFSSVMDGNVTVLIVAVVLWVLGPGGEILSFAMTLFWGNVFNLIAGVGASRLMTLSLSSFPAFRKRGLYVPQKDWGGLQKFSFFGRRRVFFVISAAVVLAGAVGLGVLGVDLDIQFKGGAIHQYTYTGEANTEAAAAAVGDALGRPVTAQITESLTAEKRLVLNVSGSGAQAGQSGLEELGQIEEALRAAFPDMTFAYAESNVVEPFFGQQYLNRGILAIAVSFTLILIYIGFRFRNIGGLSAGVMGVVALLHDAAVVVAAFVLAGIPIGSTFVAVILTIVGYSINDTIVIYDRIRENMKLHPKDDVAELVDNSIRQSFTRSLFTSVATFVGVLCIYVFAFGYGINSIKDFALPMAAGVVCGCYSSVCIAGPLWVMWKKRKRRVKA